MRRGHILLIAALAVVGCEAQIEDGRLLCATSDSDSCPGGFTCCPAAITAGYDGLCYRAACADAGTPIPDGGADGGADAGPRDAGPGDAGPRDAGPPDADPPDAGPPDAGPPPSLVSVTAGGLHTCALYSDSSAYCWGNNLGGQLGNGETRTDAGETEAVAVMGLPADVTRIVAGLVHTCALHSTGVSCWGANNLGQIGDSSTAINRVTPTPVMLSATESVVDIDAGDNHTCALLSDASVWCWGANDQAQLGRTASATPARTPVLVSGVDSVVELRAGSASTCARRSDGSVWCWGRNNQGQLGRGTTSMREETPAAVSGIDGTAAVASAIGVGGAHSCAVLAAETRCWGAGASGQLGHSMFMASDVPVVVAITGSALPTMLALGDSHSCAAGPAIDAQCWGAGNYGQIGNARADIFNYVSVPGPVIGLSTRPTDLAAGGDHACGIVGDEVWCWGRNHQGQLGNRTTTDTGTPVMVRGLP
jgi:alpha-tubulin suppressor-like RCC1 family protein